MAEKVWIANKYWNKVSHRALTRFEQRNPSTFMSGLSVHATREEAIAAMVGYRKEAVANAKKELDRTERSLAKALNMQKECGDA
ncbi:MAG: hypothetical protein J7556_15000 [Acidovorax sp.]|nr:hypothetical protein [Acidovorax sp.]